MGDKKEYIERGALIEFVKQNTPHIDGDTTMQCVERAMKAAPAADVVEVVRCKDCIHSVPLLDRLMCNRNAHKSENGWFGLRATADKHFCSYGERKDNGNA